jgi:glycosyltransferase involved in cell wall biosynthesis
LLTLLKAARNVSKDWLFILAGPIKYDDLSDTEREFVSQFKTNNPSNILFIDRLLSDSEINLIISMSDVAYIAYENFFHSSNVQLKSAFFKKPIIAGPKHLIAERTRKFGLGWCLPEISVAALTDLLNQIDENEIKRVIDNALFEEFCEEHSPERLTKCLEEISELVGTPKNLTESEWSGNQQPPFPKGLA